MSKLLLRMENIREALFDYKKKFIHIVSDNVELGRMYNITSMEFGQKVAKLTQIIRHLNPNAIIKIKVDD